MWLDVVGKDKVTRINRGLMRPFCIKRFRLFSTCDQYVISRGHGKLKNEKQLAFAHST